MSETISLLEFLNEPLKITKPIRLIELFAGYGSQALALKYLGIPFEHWKIAEWNFKSFNAYNRLQSQEMWNVPDFVYESIQTAPTISAIPTYFLYKWFGDNYNAYTDLIIEWRKENE